MGVKGVEKQAHRVTVGVLVVVCVVTHASIACSLGKLRYRNSVEEARGVNGTAIWVLIDRPSSKSPPRLVLETGQRYLFEGTGLSATFVKVGAMGKRGGLAGSYTVLSSPVGGEHLVGIEPFFATGAVAFGIDLNLYTLMLDGVETDRMVTTGGRAIFRLAEALHLGYAVENIHVLGEKLPGADTALYVITGAGRRIDASLKVGLTRNGNVEVLLGTQITLGRDVRLGVGYTDPTGVLTGALAIGVQRIRVGLGASLHPVLGMSRSVFLSWWR